MLATTTIRKTAFEIIASAGSGLNMYTLGKVPSYCGLKMAAPLNFSVGNVGDVNVSRAP